jgi:hypothetical protein
MAKKMKGISIKERFNSSKNGIFAMKTTVKSHTKYAIKAGHWVTGVETTIKINATAAIILRCDGRE